MTDLPQSIPKSSIILFAATALIAQALFWVYSMPGPQLRAANDLPTAITCCVVSLFALMLFPLIVASKFLKRPPHQLGLGLGRQGFGWKCVAFFTPGLVIATLIGSADPQIQAFYPIPGDSIGASLPVMLLWFFAYLLFYISFEVFYRGFLLRGISGLDENSTSIDRTVVIWIAIQTVGCLVIHLGKPTAELWASIPASILFGWIAWRSRSIWYGVVIHFLVGVANDLGALWQAGEIGWR